MQGLPTLKAFGQSGELRADAGRQGARPVGQHILVLGTSILTRGITDLGTAFGAAAALVLGAYRVRHGEMSLEALLIVLMAGTEIFRPLRELRTVLHQGLTGQAAAAGINALLDDADHGAGGAAPPRSRSRDAESGDLRAGHRLRSRQLRLSRRQARRASGAVFSIAAGERVGIVGPSGSGKSTIVRLLLRLHDPQTGTVRIGGHDLRALDPDAVRADDRRGGAGHLPVPRHHRGEPAPRLPGRDARPRSTPPPAPPTRTTSSTRCRDGYQTVIGERGARLSGGQRQRIAIARALLRDAPILVLDEALSSVDAENEAVIQQALDRLMAGRTTLILAHRLSSVINADRILVLEDGAVAESGSHAELIARDGPYRRLMGPQLAERSDAIDAAAAADVPAGERAGGRDRRGRARSRAGRRRRSAGPRPSATLLGFIRPWRRQLAVTVTCGIGRVVAFIGVGVLGALIIAAVRADAPSLLLVVLLLAAAPVAGLLHWLECCWRTTWRTRCWP